MKKGFAVVLTLLLFICTSCVKENYKNTEFFLKNTCDQAIEVTSTALVRYSDGYYEVTLVDDVPSGQTLSMRKIQVAEDFHMSSVFTKIEIRKAGQLSPVDALNRDRWVKTLTSDEKDEYTLTVDESFF